MRICALVLCTALVSCGGVDGDVRVVGVGQPLDDTACMVDPAGLLIGAPLVLDVRKSRSLHATLVIENTTDRVLSAARVTARCGCESDSGFESDLGPLVVPELHPLQPMCVLAESSFPPNLGPNVNQSDTVAPNQRGLIRLAIVPSDLRAVFDRTRRISRLADDCCLTPGSSCDGRTPSQSCTELKGIFEQLDPDRLFDLHVESDRLGVASEDLIRYRRFSQFDGDYSIGINSDGSRFHFGTVLPVTMRGVLELVDKGGDVVASEEFTVPVGLCANCDEATASMSTCHSRE